MKDDIKEILDILKKCYNLKDEYFGNYISLYQLGLLLDCITNLQEENKELKIFICNYKDRLTHILENGSKTYIRENLKIVINYMKDYLNDVLKGE